YVDRALDEVADHLDLFEELLAIARSQYRVGKGLQQAVLLAQLERDKLLDRRAQLKRRRADADSRLGEILAARSAAFTRSGSPENGAWTSVEWPRPSATSAVDPSDSSCAPWS
ncbi:MAG: hypothetical protein ABEK42_12210, partial [Thiohalorhabdaceae bacterium]